MLSLTAEKRFPHHRRVGFTVTEAVVFLSIFCVTAAAVPFFGSTVAFKCKSSTSCKGSSDPFDLTYLDGTKLEGHISTDRVQIGDVVGQASVGIIESTSVYWDADGILGLGFPSLAGKFKQPLFYSLTDPTNPLRPLNSSTGEPEPPLSRLFTILLDSKSGELQLGGYDPNAVAPGVSIFFTPVLNDDVINDVSLSVDEPLESQSNFLRRLLTFPSVPSYPDAIPSELAELRTSSLASANSFSFFSIAVMGMRLGDNTILDLLPSSSRIVATVDSGTSCIIFPNSRAHTRTGVYDNLVKAVNSYGRSFTTVRPSLFITIQGAGHNSPQEVEIRYEDLMIYAQRSSSASDGWFGSGADDSASDYVDDGAAGGGGSGGKDATLCAYSLDEYPDIFLLGDPFYRALVVIHDLRDPQRPMLGFGPRNRDYSLKRVTSLSATGGLTSGGVRLQNDNGDDNAGAGVDGSATRQLSESHNGCANHGVSRIGFHVRRKFQPETEDTGSESHAGCSGSTASRANATSDDGQGESTVESSKSAVKRVPEFLTLHRLYRTNFAESLDSKNGSSVHRRQRHHGVRQHHRRDGGNADETIGSGHTRRRLAGQSEVNDSDSESVVGSFWDRAIEAIFGSSIVDDNVVDDVWADADSVDSVEPADAEDANGAVPFVRERNRVALTNFRNTEYWISVYVGTPPQGPFHVIMDTGSSAFALYGISKPADYYSLINYAILAVGIFCVLYAVQSLYYCGRSCVFGRRNRGPADPNAAGSETPAGILYPGGETAGFVMPDNRFQMPPVYALPPHHVVMLSHQFDPAQLPPDFMVYRDPSNAGNAVRPGSASGSGKGEGSGRAAIPYDVPHDDADSGSCQGGGNSGSSSLLDPRAQRS